MEFGILIEKEHLADDLHYLDNTSEDEMQIIGYSTSHESRDISFFPRASSSTETDDSVKVIQDIVQKRLRIIN